MRNVLLTGLLLLLVSVTGNAKPVRHYVFFGMDRERIREATAFLETKRFEGAQIAYSWRQLEPGRDEYDFSLIREDLAFLSSKGKKLFVQIQDVSFSEKWIHVPRYLLKDPQFGGGADKQYRYKYVNHLETDVKVLGWMARRWDANVRDRFRKLLVELGKEFDGKIEGVNLAETAFDIGHSGALFPKGFTFENYRDGIIANMKAMREAFPNPSFWSTPTSCRVTEICELSTKLQESCTLVLEVLICCRTSSLRWIIAILLLKPRRLTFRLALQFRTATTTMSIQKRASR